MAAFLVFGLALGGFFIFSTIQLNSLNNQNNSLKGQLSSLTSTESSFYVLKDRIAKIKIAEAYPSATKGLTDFQPFVSSFQNSNISELDVTPGKLTATINFKSNSDLTNFMDSLSKSTIYSNVIFSSFGFNPAGGYLVSLSATEK